MRPLLLLLILFIAAKPVAAQVFIEPFAGYQLDLNNQAKNRLFNSGIQLALKKKKYEFLVQLQYSWTQHSGRYTDSSFTINPALPLYSPAIKMVKPSIFTFGIGNRIKLAGKKTNNSLFAKLYAGLMYQKVTFNYQYDKNNYTILNPDQTKDETGLFVSAGVEYVRQLPFGRIFFDVNFSTPPAGKLILSAFKFVSPLSFNIGYSIQLSKK